MDTLDNLIDMGMALGKGVLSVAEDLYFGVERTGEWIGVTGAERSAEIGEENELLLGQLTAMFETITDPANKWANPLYRLVLTIMEKYYEYFPEEALQKIAHAASIGGGYATGRLIIGKKIAEVIAMRIVEQIAAATAFKQLAVKLGVSAAAGSTGVGLVVTAVLVQGVAQRASHASQRLKIGLPSLWVMLRQQGGIDMLYFLVEGPMAKYLAAIGYAEPDPASFERVVWHHYEVFGP